MLTLLRFQKIHRGVCHSRSEVGRATMACIVLKEGKSATREELYKFLEPLFAKFWLPDVYEFVKEIPKTSVGKFKKSVLREQFSNYKAQPY